MRAIKPLIAIGLLAISLQSQAGGSAYANFGLGYRFDESNWCTNEVIDPYNTGDHSVIVIDDVCGSRNMGRVEIGIKTDNGFYFSANHISDPTRSGGRIGTGGAEFSATWVEFGWSYEVRLWGD